MVKFIFVHLVILISISVPKEITICNYKLSSKFVSFRIKLNYPKVDTF